MPTKKYLVLSQSAVLGYSVIAVVAALGFLVTLLIKISLITKSQSLIGTT